MRLLRTFAALLSVGTLAVGASACGDDGADDSEPTPTSATTPEEVEEPGDDEDVPADPDTPPTNPGGVNY